MAPADRERIVQQLRTTTPPTKPQQQHSWYAAILFFVVANTSGQRVSDFAHVAWNEITIRFSEKHGIDFLIMKPASNKTDPLGRKAAWAMIAAEQPDNPLMCPIATFKFCRAHMNQDTFGPFWRTEKKDPKEAKALFDRIVRIWRKAAKQVGVNEAQTKSINAHSIRASVATDLADLDFKPEVIKEICRWTKNSKMNEGYDARKEMNKLINVSLVKIE